MSAKHSKSSGNGAILNGMMKMNETNTLLGCIIFDLDGTLIDSMKQHQEIFGKMLYEGFGISQERGESIYIETAGKPLDEQFQIVLQQSGIRGENITRLVDEFWSRVKTIKFSPFKDVPLAIRALHNAGYSLFVTSGSTNAIVEAKLSHAEIIDCFQLVLGSDYSATSDKKGADHFRKIQKQLKLETDAFRQSTMFVGDGKHDMQLAKEEGFVGVLRTNERATMDIEADLYINDLTDLINRLKRENSHTDVFMRIAELRHT